jgi:hypothetical protein
VLTEGHSGFLLCSCRGFGLFLLVASSLWEAEVVSGTFDQLAKQVGSPTAYDGTFSLVIVSHLAILFAACFLGHQLLKRSAAATRGCLW